MLPHAPVRSCFVGRFRIFAAVLLSCASISIGLYLIIAMEWTDAEQADRLQKRGAPTQTTAPPTSAETSNLHLASSPHAAPIMDVPAAVTTATPSIPRVVPPPFVPLPSPYTSSLRPCSAYIRKDDNCAHYAEHVRSPLPACGGISAAQPGVRPFLIVGDWGHQGKCQRLMGVLAQQLESQFGRAEFIVGLGDTAYWDATCEDLRNAFDQSSSASPDRTSYFNSWLNPERAGERAACRTPTGAHDAHVPSSPRARIPLSAQDRYYPVLGNHDFDHWHRLGLPGASWPYFQYFSHLLEIPEEDNSETLKGEAYVKTFFKDAASSAVAATPATEHPPSPGLQIVTLNSELGSDAHDERKLHRFAEQAAWLERQVKRFHQADAPSGTKPVRLMIFHRPPFSTVQHDAPATWMDAEYEEMGFDAVFFGHQHAAERLTRNVANSPSGTPPTIPYFLNGFGAHPYVYDVHSCPAYPGSQFRYNSFHGVQLGLYHYDEETGRHRAHICFYSLEDGGKMVDHTTVG
jgi:hypothetical protein